MTNTTACIIAHILVLYTAFASCSSLEGGFSASETTGIIDAAGAVSTVARAWIRSGTRPAYCLLTPSGLASVWKPTPGGSYSSLDISSRSSRSFGFSMCR